MTIGVSVIIPTFNRWPVLCRAIDSALAQSYRATEIIIIDDGSTDDTAHLLQNRYADQITLYSQTNAGVSAARNTGLAKAKEDWIALLDSDDEWLPDKLKCQVDLIKTNKDCVLCHTEEIWIRNGVRVNPMKKHKKSGGDIFDQCLPLCAISPSSTLINKYLLDSVGQFDESLPACEDYDLWLRICANHEVHFLDQPLLIKYGGHQDQLSRKYWGMDRFRIQALQNLLNTEKLSEDKRNKTIEMLVTKTRILLTGAIKHTNESLAEECQSILHRYESSIKPESPMC